MMNRPDATVGDSNPPLTRETAGIVVVVVGAEVVVGSLVVGGRVGLVTLVVWTCRVVVVPFWVVVVRTVVVVFSVLVGGTVVVVVVVDEAIEVDEEVVEAGALVDVVTRLVEDRGEEVLDELSVEVVLTITVDGDATSGSPSPASRTDRPASASSSLGDSGPSSVSS